MPADARSPVLEPTHGIPTVNTVGSGYYLHFTNEDRFREVKQFA